MQDWICETCGVQYPDADEPPAHCPICEDPRQYVGPNGQVWTSMASLIASGHHNEWREEEPNCWSLHTQPQFAIGQRAYLIRTPQGNILWDCVTLLEDATREAVRQQGGLRAIAISHPHYYSALEPWSRAFGDVPVYIHEAERKWVQRGADRVRFWNGETLDLGDGLTLIRSGGHFDGYQVLHWPAGAEGRGVLFAGDQPQVGSDLRWVSFMYSYPNLIPFDAATIEQITASLKPWTYDRIYGAFGRNVLEDAEGVVARSKERYLKAIGALGG